MRAVNKFEKSFLISNTMKLFILSVGTLAIAFPLMLPQFKMIYLMMFVLSQLLPVSGKS